MRSSLRLFGLLAALAGVNVYVFFFNRGTAPREVLKPSALVRAEPGKVADDNALPAPIAAAQAAEPSSRPSPGPSQTEASAGGGDANQIASGGGTPKGPPGGSPGWAADEAASRQAGNHKGDAESGPPSPASSTPPERTPGSGAESSLENSPDSGGERKIGDADTLGMVLAREGFGGQAPRVIAALSRFLDPRLIRGGQTYAVRRDEDGEPEWFEYRPNAVTRLVATRGASGAWVAVRVDEPMGTELAAVSGTIDNSLYEAVQSAGERIALASLLVDLLAWDVNFYTDSQPGDHFKVIVEKQTVDGQFYRYGHILAAEYGGKVGTFRVFYWKPNRVDAPGRYFDEKGRAVSKSLLKTPLRYVRVSSRFDRHRFHPILHRERAHLGIDYAAPVGTPVWASSGGKVAVCEMKRGSGNTVVLTHSNGMTTRYYHLSRFARGLAPGQTVRQKDVIGFVGSTGLSTGPHLHFSVTVNGEFVDPSKVHVNRDSPVADRGAYLASIKPRLAVLDGLRPPSLSLAKN